MRIVIDIPDRIYSIVQNRTLNIIDSGIVEKAIKNGTHLPKGHGNIYDENDIKRGIENPYQCQTVLNGLKLIKPIIEADREESEE